MTTFVVANLGDAALNIATGTLIGSGAVSSSGVIKNTSGGPITGTVLCGLSFVIIKEALENANTHPISVVASDGSLIETLTSQEIALAYGWACTSDNGANYSIIG